MAYEYCGASACAFFFNQGWLYVLGCLMMVMGYGSVAPQATAFARERYGQKRFAHQLAIVNTDIAGGSALQQAVMSACGGVSLLIYTTMAIFSTVAFLTSLVFARITKPRDNAGKDYTESGVEHG